MAKLEAFQGGHIDGHAPLLRGNDLNGYLAAGIRTEHVLTMQIGLREAQYNKDPVILNFWSQLLGRVSSLPGIATTALGTNVPLTNDHWRDDISRKTPWWISQSDQVM